MPVSTLAGVVDDSTLLGNRRIIDMDPVIKLLEPDVSPFTTLTMNASSRPAKSQKVEWLEDELLPRVTQTTATLTNVATAIPVTAATGNYFRVNDIARIAETGENVLVTAVAANTLTVTRGYGTVAGVATTVTAGDIIRLGNAAAEGATLPAMLVTKQVAAYNYAQIFRNSFGFTQTLINSDLYGGPEPSYEATKKLAEHKISIEYQALWGQRKLDVSGANPRAVMGGITDFVTTNVTNIAGNLTDKLMETFFRSAFRFGSGNKLFLCSPLVGSALSSFPQSKLALPSDGQSSYGVSLKKYQSAQGQTINIVIRPDWNDFSAATGFWGAAAILIDLDHVKWRPLRTTKLMPDRQAPDEDSVKQEYLTEGAFQFIHERSHAILKNATGY